MKKLFEKGIMAILAIVLICGVVIGSRVVCIKSKAAESNTSVNTLLSNKKDKFIRERKSKKLARQVVKDMYNKKFISFLDDDLNTSSCLTVLYDMLKDNDLNDATKRKLTESFDKVLSLDLLKKNEVSLNDELVSYIEEKIALRTLAKQNKDFIEADKIRNELLEKGILLKDTREGTIWNKI